jgi:hypothetical protein
MDRLRRSLLLRVQLTRLEVLNPQGRTALAVAAGREAGRRPLLAQASRLARRIARERTGWATPLAALLEAGVAHLEGRPADAAERRRATAATPPAWPCTRPRARWRLGALLPGDEGAAEGDEAARWLAEQDVPDPARAVDLFAPGFAAPAG